MAAPFPRRRRQARRAPSAKAGAKTCDDVVVVGLGPGGTRHLTLAAMAAMANARVVLTRTERHPTLAQMPARVREKVQALDAYYEGSESFDEAYQAISQHVADEAERGDGTGLVVYAVPGDPFCAESAVQRIRTLTRADVRVVHGMSFVEPTLGAVGVDMFAPGLAVLDAMDVVAHAPFPAEAAVHTAMPTLYAQVCSSGGRGRGGRVGG